MQQHRIELPFGAQNLIIETGKLAKQANAAVTVTIGGTVVLVTACMSRKPKEGIDFFPLMVEYQEKTYSAGRIPGGFFKREGRPTQREILSARLIDRPIRPLFPEGFFNEVQIVSTVLSSDAENDPDIAALVGASAALMISDIPFDGPLGAVRVACINDQFMINPTYKQREESTMDLIVVGLKDGIIMIEGESDKIPESKIIEALEYGFKALQPIREAQIEFQKQNGKPKAKIELRQINPEFKKKIHDLAFPRVLDAYTNISEKLEREAVVGGVFDELTKDLTAYEAYKVGEKAISANDIKMIFEEVEYSVVRKLVFEKNKRADGRGTTDIRALSGEVDLLPRTHGSALFTRGQTQSLAVVTLGTKKDEQLIEDLEGVNYENFMLHYNFPSFSVGETKPMRSPGRREIGHGALAAKSLRYILPSREVFPYTIRVVSEILESNGSSSMASVCAGCLSLMDAGVPVTDMVAGISVGILTQGKDYRLLTDIMGLEDHFGDMDFKLAGTKNGVTGIQLDLKIKGLAVDILAKAIGQAKEARLKILDVMNSVISEPKADISQYAPRIIFVQISTEKIGEVIGPGGKTIKKIIEETGVESIDIEDDGRVLIASTDKESAEKAINYIKGLVEEPEVGKIYNGRVMKVTNFGAFVEFLPGRQGLVHVSELSKTFVKDVTTIVKVGDQFKVKLVEIDQMKRMNLSRKQAEEVS
jgi:polyribonucleotide nucleotidyltransferase